MNQSFLRVALFASVVLAITACATNSDEKKTWVSADFKVKSANVQAPIEARGGLLPETGYRLITPSFSLKRDCTVTPILFTVKARLVDIRK